MSLLAAQRKRKKEVEEDPSKSTVWCGYPIDKCEALLKSMRIPYPHAGWIYVTHQPHHFPGVSKYGKTSNIVKRMQSYERSTPIKTYELYALYLCVNMDEAENVLHTHFRDHRLSGKNEWVSLEASVVKAQIEQSCLDTHAAKTNPFQSPSLPLYAPKQTDPQAETRSETACQELECDLSRLNIHDLQYVPPLEHTLSEDQVKTMLEPSDCKELFVPPKKISLSDIKGQKHAAGHVVGITRDKSNNAWKVTIQVNWCKKQATFRDRLYGGTDAAFQKAYVWKTQMQMDIATGRIPMTLSVSSVSVPKVKGVYEDIHRRAYVASAPGHPRQIFKWKAYSSQQAAWEAASEWRKLHSTKSLTSS